MSTGNIVQNEADKIRLATGKQLLTLEEAANYAGIGTGDFAEIISSGDNPIKLLGKGYIRIADLTSFLYGGLGMNEVEKIVEKPLDSGFPQRYPPSKIEDLSEEGYMEMERRGKGEGSIFYNESRKVWQAAVSLGYDEKGKRRRKIISGKSEEEVGEALRLILAAYTPTAAEQKNIAETVPELGAVSTEKAKDITFKEFLDNCLKNIKGRPQSRTFFNYIGTAKHLEEGLGHILISQLTKDDCERFINGFTEKTYARGKTVSKYGHSMIHKIYIMLKMVLREAVDRELIRKNFVDSIKEPRSKKYEEPKYKALSDDELKKIFEAVNDNPMIKTATIIMNYTGMRPGEVFALKIGDIDFANKTISVNRALSLERDVDIETKKYIGRRRAIIKEIKNERGGKVENAKRTLKVSDNVLETIENYLRDILELIEKRKKHGMEDFIFSGVNGNLVILEYYQQVYERQLAKKGLDSKKLNLYRFRHTYCTRLAEMGTDPTIMMQMMGDNTIDIVMKVYRSVKKEDILAASSEYAAKMDATLVEA